MYNPQMYYSKIDNQIRELEAMKGQIPQPITQNFQISPANTLKMADSIDEVEKTMVMGDTPFFSRDMSILWIKNIKNEIKSYELKEIVQKDEKDLKIEYLEAQIEELRRGMNESNANSNESTTSTNQE